MRLLLAFLLIAAALWRGWLDWQATIGQGYAYRLKPVGQVLADTWPQAFERFVAGVQGSSVPFLWDPIGMAVFAVPLALLAALLAAGLWVTRRWG